MKIKRFTARDMTEALKEVHRTLGPDAVILETKAVSNANGSDEGVVVLAAIDRHLQSPLERTETRGLARLADRASPEGISKDELGEATQSAGRNEAAALRTRLGYLNRLVASDHFSRIPIPLRELYLDLVAAEVDSNLAFALLRMIADQGPVDLVSEFDLTPLRRRLRALLLEPRVRPGDRPTQVVLLVGPTGAGKTTVAAALAARSLRNGHRPGLVSLDTFRAAGPATLEQYARILGVPFVASFEPVDLVREAPPELSACDLLIVDTPAATPRDRAALEHVRLFQDAFTSPELHLVLPATSKVRDMAAALEMLHPLGLSSLIFTRIDETNSYGGMLSISIKARLPVSFLGRGRDVLADLTEASPDELISLVLDRCPSGGWVAENDRATEERPAPEPETHLLVEAMPAGKTSVHASHPRSPRGRVHTPPRQRADENRGLRSAV